MDGDPTLIELLIRHHGDEEVARVREREYGLSITPEAVRSQAKLLNALLAFVHRRWAQ